MFKPNSIRTLLKMKHDNQRKNNPNKKENT